MAKPKTGDAATLSLGGIGVFPHCHGVVNVLKESNCTSHDVVARIRRALGGQKVGHGGTLDPSAIGVLPILIGRATRLAEHLVQWDKEYRALLRLGETTETQDATGVVLDRRACDHLTDEMIRRVAEQFQGTVKQVPPMYSAIKVSGVPLYKAARAGRTVEREARTVTIHSLTVIGVQGRDVRLRVVCSKGTYVRTLCADIGKALGVGGHLAHLERTRVGPLEIDQSLTVGQVEALYAQGRLGQKLMSLDQALERMPALRVNDQAAEHVVHGVPVPVDAIESVEPATTLLEGDCLVRIKSGSGRLLALGQVSPSGLEVPISTTSIGKTIRAVKVLVDSPEFHEI